MQLSETRMECWYKRVEVISRLPDSHSFEGLKSILFQRKLNQAAQASDTRNAAALVSETKPLAIEFRAAPVSKLRMAIPTTPSSMTTGKQIRVLVRNCPTFQTHTCMLAWCWLNFRPNLVGWLWLFHNWIGTIFRPDWHMWRNDRHGPMNCLGDKWLNGGHKQQAVLGHVSCRAMR